MNNPLVDKAYKFAKLSLVGKKRYSGESYEDHGINVASILERYDVKDPTTLTVAVLHHSVEDGAATIKDIEKEFGLEVASMLKTLDSLSVIKMTDNTPDHFVENLRKMFLYLAKDLRIVLIKLGDILDNLRTLKYIPKYRQRYVAKQAIEIFAPLAERLGIGELKGEMQDLAFPFVYPNEYLKTRKLLKINSQRLSKRTKNIERHLQEILTSENIPFRIESRAKHLYSLYSKLKRPEVGFDISKIYDLIAFRVIVSDIKDCYRVLGIIHNLWKPMPNRLRDYISNPKPNGYKSLHTTVFGPGEVPFEIQVRTEGMHEDAEYGIAAHWHYDDAKFSGKSGEELDKGVLMDKEKLRWVQNLRKWQEEVTDNKEFLRSIKTDFFGARIFVLTPRGDVKDLPVGATPIDFAYSIHTHLGDKANGAKVNGKLVTLNHKLKNGDVIEILVTKDKNKKPSSDWLSFVTTSLAKKKIKSALNKL